MKAHLSTFLCATVGFLAGFGLLKPGADSTSSTGIKPVRPSPRKAGSLAKPWDAPGLSAAQRMRLIAERAASVSPGEWPAIFQSRIHSPEGTRLVERLWAEQDPEGFWNWLKQQRDGNTLTQYGTNLLRIWAKADPNAAMRAANEITDKQASDTLRREVIETVIAVDLRKGLQLASEALDFNRFSWGQREWMKTDPAAAVLGLAALPKRSEFRYYLKFAVEEWAKTDSRALMDWLKQQQACQDEEWFGKAFTAAATADPQSALESAGALTDPATRDVAISGVLASGRIPDEQMPELLGQLTVPRRADAMFAALDKLPLGNEPQIANATRLLNQAPASRNMLNIVEKIGQAYATQNLQNGFSWAAGLPDSSMRRRALAGIASYSSQPDQLDALAAHAGQVPLLDLSDAFFQIVMNHLPDDKEEEWIARLPRDRAEWARTFKGRKPD